VEILVPLIPTGSLLEHKKDLKMESRLKNAGNSQETISSAEDSRCQRRFSALPVMVAF